MAEISRENEDALSHDTLLSLIHYCPTTGIFTNKAKRAGVAIGKILGTRLANGYIALTVLGRRFLAHRLAWFYMTKQWPKCYIDHIDRIRDNNIFSNLREVDEYESVHNTSMLKTNTSGFTGVRKMGKKWQSKLYYAGEEFIFGCFDTPELAYNAREEFKKEHNLL